METTMASNTSIRYRPRYDSRYLTLTVEGAFIAAETRAKIFARIHGNRDSMLMSDRHQDLIALQRALLHDYHNFFLPSQPYFAIPVLQQLAAKYFIPEHVWSYNMHSFLQLLCRRLPNSIEYMLVFRYLENLLAALLHRTVPAFENTWIKCLGDLGRYQMAIMDKDFRYRGTCVCVVHSWNTKVTDEFLSSRRLHHQLDIRTRPAALQQLYSYPQSLTCLGQVVRGRESILTNLDPVAGRTEWRRNFREELCLTIDRLERTLHSIASLQKRVFKIFSVTLESNKSNIATFLCAVKLPIVSALSDSDPVQIRTPIFRSDTPYDYLMYGIMLLYLGIMIILRIKTNLHSYSLSLSFALMTGMGLLWVIVNRDEFADGIRETVFEIWLTGTLHVGAQFCYDNHSPEVHVVTFLGLLTIFGLAMMSFPSMSPLHALPPFVAIVALIVWAFHEHEKTASRRQQSDAEQGDVSALTDGGHVLVDMTPSDQQGSGVHEDQSNIVASAGRAQNPRSQNTPPDRGAFSVSNSTGDFASLRSDNPHISRRV